MKYKDHMRLEAYLYIDLNVDHSLSMLALFLKKNNKSPSCMYIFVAIRLPIDTVKDMTIWCNGVLYVVACGQLQRIVRDPVVNTASSGAQACLSK